MADLKDVPNTAILIPGLEAALLGVVMDHASGCMRGVYDMEKAITFAVLEHGLTPEEAAVSFARSLRGDGSDPMFLTPIGALSVYAISDLPSEIEDPNPS